MKALFAHDHRFITGKGAVWSESQFEMTLWSRYLAHFDALTVVARRGEMPAGKTTEMLEYCSAQGVTFELFFNLSSLQGLTLRRPGAWRRMRDLVEGHDAVIARLPSEIGLLAIAAARAARKPWAVEIVGCSWDALWHYGSFAGRIYAPLAYLRMRRAVRCADHAIYVTKDFLQHRYPSHAANLASASNVVLSDMPSDVLEARCSRIAALGGRHLRLGLIGTLRGRYKGIQTLLAALADARRDIPALKVYILGGGDPEPWRVEAARLGVDDLVVFDGTLPSGEPVLNWLDNVDVYLQPSLQEGLPRALIEAMSRGCPAIASSVAGIPELLPAEDMVCPGDAVALAALFRRRLHDHNWMISRAYINWEKAQNYRADQLAARRAAFWERFSAAVDQNRQ